MNMLLVACIFLVLTLTALVWYDRRQARTHSAMREHNGHQPLVEHTDTDEA